VSLEKGLTKDNNRKGFQTIGIYPINKITMDSKVGPSLTFEIEGEKHANNIEAEGSGHCSSANEDEDLQPWQVEEVNTENIDNMLECTQYYVDILSDMEEGMYVGI